MLGGDERILFLKFVEQGLELIDGGKAVNDDPPLFFGAVDQLLFALPAAQAVVGPESGRALAEAGPDEENEVKKGEQRTAANEPPGFLHGPSDRFDP